MRKKSDAADTIIKTCATSEYKPACYDKEIPKLMKKMTMEEVFGVTKRIQSQDSTYAFCHVLGHALSAAETKKDPSMWQEVITRCPSGVCSNGCVHGAFQERFRTDVLTSAQIQEIKPDLSSVCEPRGSWSPTGMEQATCYHALGHLLMYITGADIGKSTILCDELAGKKETSSHDFHRICYDGAYMQIFQPLEPEDIALIQGREQTRQTVNTFCSQFIGERQASCVGESWPLYLDDLVRNPSFVETFCGPLRGEFKERCYNGLFYILVVQFQFNLDRIKDYCSELRDDLAGRCFANTASRLIETDWSNIEKAVAWCGEQKVCLDELVSYADYNFHKNSEEFYALCNALPQPWRDTCLKN